VDETVSSVNSVELLCSAIRALVSFTESVSYMVD
jgi:hypothetical protein